MKSGPTGRSRLHPPVQGQPDMQPAEAMASSQPAILVLCTGNSCRSQMAEAFLRRHGAGRFAVYSAGTEPAAEIHPLTRSVLAEAGIDLAGQRPKHLREVLGKVPVRTLILVCDSAARSCPAVWPGVPRRLHWPFEDPAAFEGTDEEKLRRFCEVRNAIEARVLGWLAQEEVLRDDV